MNKIVLITGGVRSGKSKFAEQYAGTFDKVAYIATCEAQDEEMNERISMHQLRRPSEWQTIEEPLRLASQIAKLNPTVGLLIDCLGLWVSNHLLSDEPAAMENPESFIAAMEAKSAELLTLLRQRHGSVVIVTNEVGLGLVPPYKLGRVFRDCLGRVNSLVAQQANEVYLCTAGIPLCLKRDGVILNG